MDLMRTTSLVIFCLLALTFSSPAQTPLPQVDTERQFNIDPALRAEEVQTRGRFMDGIAPSSPGDDDLGLQQILSRRDKYKAFTIFGDVSGFYTSNAFLTKNNTQGDAYVVGQVGGVWQPQIVGNLFGEINLRQQFYRYDQFSILDFNSLNTGGGLSYLLQDFGEVLVSLKYNYNRLSPGETTAAFYESHTITPGAQKIFSFSRAHFAYVGWNSAIQFTDPYSSNTAPANAIQRDEHSLFAGYNVKLTRALTAQAYYRLSYYDYAFGGRDDLNQTASLGVSYNFTDWVALYASFSANFNNSNKSVFDYTSTTSGGGLSLRYRF